MPQQTPSNTSTGKSGYSVEWLNKFLLPAFIIYCIAVLAGIMFHESWADEAQSWLIARDCSLSELFKLLPEEGHPPLWFLLLFIPAKLGLPYQFIKWLCACIMIASVYLLQFRTKFSAVLKLSIPFSYFFFFEYALLARSYCLLVFFITAILVLYPNRFRHPFLFTLCVIGLFNTHILIFSFAAILTFSYLFDAIHYKQQSKTVYAAFVAMFIGGFYLVPYMAGSRMADYYNHKLTHHIDQVKTAITNSMLISGNETLGIILFMVFIIFLAKRAKPLLVLLSGIAGMLCITAYYYEPKIRHDGILFLMMFATYGLTFYYDTHRFKLLKGVTSKLDTYGIWGLAIVVLIQLPSTLKSYTSDMNTPYSGSREAAEYLMENKTDSSIIVAYQATSTLSVLPYLNDGTKFYYAECERFGTYYVYDTCFRKETWMYAVDYAVKVAHDHYSGRLNNILFLFNYPVQERTLKFLDLKYQTSETPLLWEESFYVYKFKEGVK